MRQGESSLHLGAARKLHHVWAAASEGAGPPQRLGDAKPVAFLSRGGWSPEQGVVKFRADRPTAARLERWEPRRGEKRRGDTPPTPRAASGSARELFIHKKDKTPREARVSQNRSRRRGPHRASAQGMYRDFGEPGPSSGAGSTYGRPAQLPQAQAQAAQQQVRLAGPPRGTWVWTALGVLELVWFASSLGPRPRAAAVFGGRDRGSYMFYAVQEPVFPVVRGTGAARGATIYESPPPGLALPHLPS